jgi:L-alanine-DL-glutamate epimerase-like enolase superfamily enzyme
VAIPNLIAMEYDPRDEDKGTIAAFNTTLVRRGGYFEVPDSPGMGVQLFEDWAAIAPPLERPISLSGLMRNDGSVISGSSR